MTSVLIRDTQWRDFSGDPVVKTQGFHCRGAGSIPRAARCSLKEKERDTQWQTQGEGEKAI